ncbi:Wzz/FepE/Etk N-terminal domain-containing protein [Desulfoluna spongiiphila]|uniref:Wzz/FepE/Etk N-terminal domain-containing protein n=1 Tax=Desulfoluna spongiiphila TaxID=419481 RepID=UPI001253D8D2|nr:Wzz/FepE/Etk N-terminal domain-containing protein [Desulfoluna spongiiphila]VVS94858.1 polysaccharide chain length determinant n-terminal domain [Desulfoluna spongiiphila]
MTSETNNDPQRLMNPMPSFHAMPYTEDEIDLKELFAILWGRKKFIGVGVFLCVLVTSTIVFSIPNVYRVRALVRPGIVSQVPGRGATFTQPLVGLKGRIDAGEFTAKLIENLKKKYPNLLYSPDSLEVFIPKNSNALRVSYDSPDQEFGKSVLELLISALHDEDDETVSSIVKDLRYSIESNGKKMIEYGNQQKNIASRIVDLENLEKNIIKEVFSLSIERKNYIAESIKNLTDVKSSNGNIENALFHNSLVIQNRQYFLDLKREQRTIGAEIGLLEDRLLHKYNLVKEVQLSIDEDRQAIQNIKNFNEIAPVMADNEHVSPNRKLIILMSFVCGIFVMILSAFIVEYVRPRKE